MYNTFLYNQALYNGTGVAIGDSDQDDIVFNGYSLQSSTITVTELINDNYPSRALDIEDIPRDHGQVQLSQYWRQKTISMSGYLRTTTASEMAELIKVFKYNCAQPLANLDIKVDGTIYRYIATCTNADVMGNRKGYHITLVPFKLDFVCVTPFSRLTDYTVFDWLDKTSLSLSEQVDNAGTAPATPVIVLNFSAASAVSGVSFENVTTGKKISISATINAGDYLRIDGENKTVELNGTTIDYSGTFPDLKVGGNSVQTVITGTSATYSETVKFYTSFL